MIPLPAGSPVPEHRVGGGRDLLVGKCLGDPDTDQSFDQGLR